ncbi:MAG: aldo/keto reductase [Planctomycetota bacterium]|jgi:predicted aldo/keto reductase-like oxidoreductase
MSRKKINRREFMQVAAISAASAASILSAVPKCAKAEEKQVTDTSKILNYNPDMEYRRLGSTDLMISAVSMGGHTGDLGNDNLDKNRKAVIDRCMEIGINYVDSCCEFEVEYCCRVLKGRRDKMYLALSHCEAEVRKPPYRTSQALLESLNGLLKSSGQDYTDIWRITCHQDGSKHTFNTSCEMVDALEKAKQQGKARFIGISSHDRRWLSMMVREFPQLDVVLFPYTSMTKNAPRDSIFDTLKKHDIGAFGIKPYARGSIFKGNSQPDSPDFEEDNRMARLALRSILTNPDIIPIPGLSHVEQVDNVALALKERRELDLTEQAALDKANSVAMANLPAEYTWLRDWEYV